MTTLASRAAQVSVVLWVGALGLIAMGARLRTIGTWLPETPFALGAWAGTRATMDARALRRLGNAPVNSSVYRSPLGEVATLQIIAPTAIQTFDDPLESGGQYEIVAERDVRLAGPARRIRATAYRHRFDAQTRLVAYSWWQSRSGATAPLAAGARDKTRRRFVAGLRSLIGGDRCLIRLIAKADPEDTTGMRTRRTLDRLAEAAIESIAMAREPDQR
ncbi:MAG: hypothetical protein ACKO5K_06730 [Armatimonadota bacterium]